MINEYIKLTDISNPKQWKTISSKEMISEGYPVYGANGVIGFHNDFNHSEKTLLITCRGATCGKLNISVPFSYINGNAMALDDLNENIDINFLYYFLKFRGFKDIISGSAQPQITRSSLNNVLVPDYSLKKQKNISNSLELACSLIKKRKEQLIEMDKLIQSIFYKLFVYEKTSWKKYQLSDVLKIDTKMTTDFEKYKDGYYVGIENIEKNTGKLINLNKVSQVNLKSGKYLFDQRHIIYSKIRPNLNKVALPRVSGICSADSYPLLPIDELVNKFYLSYVLRSKDFLNYIEKQSSRTNIPKVNKKQLSSYNTIVPPIELQNKFASIVEEIEAQKKVMEQSLKEMENNFNALMQKAFKGELFPE